MEQEELRYQSMYRSSKHDGDMSPSSFEQFKVRQHAVWISISLILSTVANSWLPKLDCKRF